MRRRFGRVGGAVAGLTLALTPIAVAISRDNNPDAALILCCVAALWFTVRAFEDGRTKWIVLAGAAVGLGFEAKMGVALLVVPGIVLAWLWTSPHRPLKTIRQLLAGGAAMVAVGGAWPLLVTLTPAADRPWISGTSDNSIWSLITGYNGVGRLAGQSGGPGGAAGGGLGGGGSTTFGGNSGVLRLLNTALGGQAGWLLGFAVVSAIGLVVLTRLRRRDATSGWIIAIGGAFLASAVTFSFAQGILHPYYVSFLAPFSAALVGAGAAQLLRRDRHARVLAPLAIGAGLATELAVLHSEHTLSWLEPILIVVAIAGAAVLAFRAGARVRMVAVATVLATLSIAPAAWAVDTLGHATSATFPAGGPATVGAGGFGGGAGPLAGAPGAAAARSGATGGPTAAIAGLLRRRLVSTRRRLPGSWRRAGWWRAWRWWLPRWRLRRWRGRRWLRRRQQPVAHGCRQLRERPRRRNHRRLQPDRGRVRGDRARRPRRRDRRLQRQRVRGQRRLACGGDPHGQDPLGARRLDRGRVWRRLRRRHLRRPRRQPRRDEVGHRGLPQGHDGRWRGALRLLRSGQPRSSPPRPGRRPDAPAHRGCRPGP